MLGKCLSYLILQLVTSLSKYLGRPLHQYVAFDRTLPFLKLRLTGITIRFRQLHLLEGWNVLLLNAGLPFLLQVALIEQISIHIGVCSPITIEASGVYMLSSTTTEKCYNEEESKKRALLRKRKQLKDLQFNDKPASPHKSNGCIVRKLSRLVLLFFIRRLKLSVSNVHLRLEDDCSGDDEEHIAAGVAFQKLVIKETPSGNVTRLDKCIGLFQVSVYLNSMANPGPLNQSSEVSAVEKLKALTFTDALGYAYILRPSMISAQLDIDQVNRSYINVFLDVRCLAMNLSVSDDQLRLLIKFLSFIKHQALVRHISRLRPSHSRPVHGNDSSRAWWQFAINSVLHYLNEKRGRAIWDSIKLHRSLGTEYSELYSLTLTSATLSKKQSLRLQALEDEMDLLGIMVWRSKVWRGLKLRRLLDGLSEHLTKKSRRVQSSSEKTGKAFMWAFGGSFMCDSISVQLTEEEDNRSRSLLGFNGSDLRTAISLQPLLRFGVSVQSLELTGLAHTPDQSGPVLLQTVTEGVISDSQRLLSLEFARTACSLSHTSSPSHGQYDPKKNAELSLFDYALQLHLQPTVFIFDKGTAIEVCHVANVIIRSSSTPFASAMKEYSRDVTRMGKQRLKFSVKNQEIISISADVHLPLLVLPSDSNKKRHVNAVMLNPGRLTVSTSIVSEETEKPVVQYDVKLCDASLFLSSQDDCSLNLLVKHAASLESESTRKLVSFKEANVKLLAIVSLPNTIVTSIIEAASYADTLSELVNITTSVKTRKLNFLHDCISRTDHITDTLILEVVDQIQSYPASIGKQAIQSGTISRIKSLVQLAFEIGTVFVELTSEEGPVTHCLSSSVNDVAVKLEYNYHGSWHGQLDVGCVSVLDTTSVSKEVRSRVKMFMTGYNVNQLFLTAGGVCGDSGSVMDYTIKNSVYVDMGPLDVFVSDKSLSVWLKILTRTYNASVSSINSKGVKSSKKHTSMASRIAPQNRMCEAGRGIVALSCTVFLKEVSVTLGSGSIPISRMSLFGIAVEIRDTIVVVESTGSVDSLCVLDTVQTNAAGSPVIYSNDLERVLKFKACLKRPLPGTNKPQTHSRPMLDPDNSNVNMGADITVGGVSCQLLYKFVSTLQVYVKRIGHQLSSTMLALQSSKRSRTENVAKHSTEPLRYHLSVNIHTTSLTIPEETNSANLLELCVDSMLLSHKYTIVELTGEGGESYYPLVETVQFDFHQLSIYRKDGEDVFKLLNLPNAGVSLSRIVSDAVPVQALNSEPYFKVSFTTEVLEMITSNRDLNAILNIAHRNIGDFETDELQVVTGAGELLEGEALSQEVDGPPDVASNSEDMAVETYQDPRGGQEPGQREESVRSLLQLDVELKRLDWLTTYLDGGNTKGSYGSLHNNALQNIFLSTKLILDDLFATLNVDSGGDITADFWLMDLSLKEVPCDIEHRKTRATDNRRRSCAVDVNIIHQSLYYKKAKPPRFGGGSMDTSRSSSKDVVMHAAITYSKQEIQVCLTVQHIHVCVWSQLLSLAIVIAARSNSHWKQSQEPSLKEDEQEMQESQAASGLQLKVLMHLDTSSLALSDKPPNTLSNGMCVEVMSLSRDERSKLEVVFSSTETRLSASPVHFAICLVQFSQDVIKLVQVMEPCSIKALYHLKENVAAADMEETVHVTLSKIIISLSMEAVYALVKLFSRALESVKSASSREDTGIQRPSKKGLWEMEEMDKDWLLELSKAPPESSTTLQKTPVVIRRKQMASLEVLEVVVHFDIISAGSSSSVLSLTAMAEAAAQSWSSDIVADARFELGGFVYNRRVGAWEPLIEPTEDPIHSKFRRWAVIAKVRNISSVDAEDGKHIREGPGSVSSLRSDTAEAGSSPTRAEVGSPPSRAEADSLLTRAEAGSPLTRAEAGSPLTRAEAGSPPTRAEAGSPPTRAEAGSPLTRAEAGSPLTRAEAGSPLTRAEAVSAPNRAEASSPPTRELSASEATIALQVDRLDKKESYIEEEKVDDDECFGEHEPQKLNEDHKHPIVVVITSDDRLEFTVTPGALETFFEIIKASGQEASEMAKHLAWCSHAEMPLQIRNETGLVMSVYPGPTLAVGNPLFSHAIHLLASHGQTKSDPTASAAHIPAAVARCHNPLFRSESCVTYGSTASTSASLSVVSLSYAPVDTHKSWRSAWRGGDNNGGEKEDVEEWNDYLISDGFDTTFDFGEGNGAYSSLANLRSSLKERKEKQKSTHKEEPPELFDQVVTRWLPGTPNHKICIQAKGGMKSRPISITLPGRMPIPLYVSSFGGDVRGGMGRGSVVIGVCEVSQEQDARVITLRSALQIKNEFPRTISLYGHSDGGTELICEVKPRESYSLSVTLFVAKTPLKLGIGPRGLFGDDILDWNAMTKCLEEPVYFSSPVGLSQSHRFYIQALMSTESMVTRVGMLDKSFHLLTLKPAFVIHNLLPMTVTILLELDDLGGDAESKKTIPPGKAEHFLHVNPKKAKEFKIEVTIYRGLHWKGKLVPDYNNSRNFHSKVKLESHNLKGERMDKMNIGMYSDSHVPAVHRLYAPYWLHNRTGLELEYEYQRSKCFSRGTKILEGPGDNSCTLLYFKPDFDKKGRMVKLRLAGSIHWSKEISLESTGRTESVVVKSNDGRSYELSIYSSNFTNVLTRIIHIVQRVTIYNSTEVLLQVGGVPSEESSGMMADTWITLEPNQKKVFLSPSLKEVVIRMQSSSGLWAYATQPFNLTKIGRLALATICAELELPGVTVEVDSDDDGSSIAVNISPYIVGTAPYCIENMCTQHSIKVRQSSSMSEVSIPPGWWKLYLWESPLLEWTLYWQVVGEVEHAWCPITDRGSRDVEVFVGDNGHSLTAAAELLKGAVHGKGEVYWMVSYDGTQRVFQVFDNFQVYNLAMKTSHLYKSLTGASVEPSGGPGAASLHVYCSMEGLGLSLLNGKPEEVIYCTVSSSPAVWLKSSEPGARFRVLEDEQLLEAEAAWRTGEKEMQLGSEMFNLSTLRGSRGGTLMRSFNPGFWGSFLVSSHYFTVSAKVGRVQVDNQLKYYALSNRIVFAAEKTWEPEKLISPVIEAAIVMRRPNTNQQVTIVENAYLKLKDVQINVELGLIAAIFPLIEPLVSAEMKSQFYAIDIAKAMSPSSTASFKASTTASTFLFRSLSISPVKVVFTYSTANVGRDDLSVVVGDLVEILLQLTSIFSHGSVTISLDSLKFSSESSTAVQLYGIICGHYKNEILSQLYSVILGLDLIGNPSNFFQNIELGIKDLVEETRKGFEEDYTASEVIGVAVGVKQFLGHVVEGSVESLTSSIGVFQRTILIATDLDYKRRHRQLQNETPETLLANLTLGARFFVQGLLGGLTDIFIKPISGAKVGGAQGFVTGLGRGALSILAKPTLGVVDLAYFTLEGVRSFVDDDIEVQTMRLPRLVHPDKIIRPYRLHDAQGLNILWHNDDSEGTQYYGHHYLPVEDGKDARVLFINSLNILQLKRGSTSFKVDDLNIKLEYMQKWHSQTKSDGLTYLLITHGEDSTLEKIGSFFGISHEDHTAELVKDVSIQVDSPPTAEYLLARITAACEGVLAYYAVQLNS